jgi:lipid-A-disaccharide synthase
VWAWKSGRVHELNKYCDQILVILPFEKEFYAKYKIPVTYVGHPLLEHMQTQYAANTKRETQTKTIALLPGSRKQEITKILPTMLEVAKRMPQHVFVIAQAPNTQDAWLQTAHAVPNCSVVKNNTYNTIAAADAALVASGTATLETALIGTPQIVVYRANPISVWLARKWVGSRIRFISLVNLILDREAVPELIQERCSVDECFAQLTSLLNDSSKQLQDYNELKTLLGNGTTSTEAAKIVIATGNSGSN